MLAGLDHINIRTRNLPSLVRFYTRVLDLLEGPRPSFPFAGAWLYCGEDAVVHLVEVSRAPPETTDLKLEHVAFRGTDQAKLLARLDRESIPYRIAKVPGMALTQVHLHDPDGNHLHIDFAGC